MEMFLGSGQGSQHCCIEFNNLGPAEDVDETAETDFDIAGG